MGGLCRCTLTAPVGYDNMIKFYADALSLWLFGGLLELLFEGSIDLLIFPIVPPLLRLDFLGRVVIVGCVRGLAYHLSQTPRSRLHLPAGADLQSPAHCSKSARSGFGYYAVPTLC